MKTPSLPSSEKLEKLRLAVADSRLSPEARARSARALELGEALVKKLRG